MNVGELKTLGNRLIKFLEQNYLIDIPDQRVFIFQLIDVLQKNTFTQHEGYQFASEGFEVWVHPAHEETVNANQQTWKVFENEFLSAAMEAGVHFRKPPTIKVITNDQIEKGECIVRITEPLIMPAKQGKKPPVSENTLDIPHRSFLIVGGTELFALNKKLIKIGRRLDNHLIIDDPRVSRCHAQLEARTGSFAIKDMGSSGGTFVNGEEVREQILKPGDVISLAGVPLVYGQDAIHPILNELKYNPPDSVDGSTTSSNLLDDLDLETFTK